MSQYRLYTPTHEVHMGVDRPLNHVFATVFLRVVEDDSFSEAAPQIGNSPNWEALPNFDPSDEGLMDAVHAVEQYLSDATGEDVKIPKEMIAACEKDLGRLFFGESVNFAETFGTIPPAQKWERVAA